ncbi:MAG: translocation/assembly module TamB, partial [Geminicoccaceae bacterium]|nr:translocation/assembly module TamB [Geminicoccaceae bacterium]
LQKLQGRDRGEGRLEGTGEVALAGLAWRLRLEARGFQVLANELGNAVVSGTAEANGRGAEGALWARLEVERAEIRIPDPPPAVPATIPVEEIGRGARHEIEPAAPPAPPFALDVRIRAENQVFVRGRGLESEWFGDVRARGTLAEPDVVGRIELRRGRLDLLGSRFVLKEGLIEFDGAKPPLPRLDVVGEARKADITARVGLRGRAPKFDIVMESEPPLPRDEILARVLFGREMARITPIQAAVLANSVATLQGGGIDALSPVRGAIGLDTLDVGGDDNGGAAIRAGKYVTERVYVEMQRGVTPESSRARVEVDLGNNLRGTTEVRETGRTGFGIEWRYDY